MRVQRERIILTAAESDIEDKVLRLEELVDVTAGGWVIGHRCPKGGRGDRVTVPQRLWDVLAL